ncbi:hypothetical protein FA15DRAFT_733973 [Coprinopsis marcescibilis]|uniref:DUF6589 domain-containing protein n=1 Tax=Coprinopsis marcescibilis TaxID=230819 RepID=A0A5C3KCF5_COPMA|nr:hypothetical protein FA15DRAFT_733973 [Coprinopsis marcescibilis]
MGVNSCLGFKSWLGSHTYRAHHRWGKDGRWIAADLYLEHLNLLVKRIYVAQGNGVTIEYIMQKGLACIEAFGCVSHTVATFFGDPDRRRQSKEIAFEHDMMVLIQEMEKHHLHYGYGANFVPVMPKTGKGKMGAKTPKVLNQPKSSVIDVWVAGAQAWSDGKWNSFLETSSYDPAAILPVQNRQSKTLNPKVTEDMQLGCLPNELYINSFRNGKAACLKASQSSLEMVFPSGTNSDGSAAEMTADDAVVEVDIADAGRLGTSGCGARGNRKSFANVADDVVVVGMAELAATREWRMLVQIQNCPGKVKGRSTREFEQFHRESETFKRLL